MTCTCGHVHDEHFDDEGKFGPCTIEDCMCVYFEADPDAEDE